MTHKGIWVILGILLLGSTLDISTLDSTTWSTQVSEYPRGYLSTQSTHRVLKYSSIKLKLRY